MNSMEMENPMTIFKYECPYVYHVSKLLYLLLYLLFKLRNFYTF